MSDTVEWSGLDEFKAFLRTLPEDLAQEAGPIVTDAATLTFGEIRNRYTWNARRKRGKHLRDSLQLEVTSSDRYGAGATVINRAKHASIFEYGTQARHTDLGYNRGPMPPANFFISVAIKHRRAMFARLVAMVERHGFTVTTGG